MKSDEIQNTRKGHDDRQSTYVSLSNENCGKTVEFPNDEYQP